MRDFIKYGDGKNIHLWLDWWYLDGVLFHKEYGYRVAYDAQRKIKARLSSVLKDGRKVLVLETSQIRGLVDVIDQ